MRQRRNHRKTGCASDGGGASTNCLTTHVKDPLRTGFILGGWFPTYIDRHQVLRQRESGTVCRSFGCGAREQQLEQIAHAANRLPERQRFAAAEEQPVRDVAAQRGGQARIDAEVAEALDAVAQAAHTQAFERRRAALLERADLRANARLVPQITLEPRRLHRARRQPRDAQELDDVVRLRVREHALEVRMRIALLGDRERRAHLHAVRAFGERRAHRLVAVDAARDDERDALALEAERGERLPGFVDDPREFEARIVHVVEARHAEMAARAGRMLDHDRIGQTPFLHPLLQHERDAAAVRQDRDQRDVVPLRHVRQIERQARAHHDRVRAELACDAHIVGVRAHRLHHVDRDHAAPLAPRLRALDLARERLEVRRLHRLAIRMLLAALDQIGMVMAQVDARDRAERAFARDASGEPMRGDADAHPALHDGQQRTAADHQRRKGNGTGHRNLSVRQKEFDDRRLAAKRFDHHQEKRHACACTRAVSPQEKRRARCVFMHRADASGVAARDARLAASRALVRAQLHRFVFEIFVEAVHAVLAADARLFETAERRGHVPCPAVDIDLPRADAARDAHRALVAARPHRAAEPVRRIVRDAHRVILVAIRENRQHRAEDLLLRDRRVGLHAPEHGRLHEEAARDALRHAEAARDELRAFVDAAPDVILHALLLDRRRERAEPRRVVARIARDIGLRGGLREVARLLVARFGHEHARMRGARLPGVQIARGHRALHRGREIGVVENHRRRFAAQFERDALHAGRGELGDALARARRAGERHHVDIGVARERLADDGPVAAHEIEHAGGQPRVVNRLGEDERIERCDLGRLQRDRAARRERGRDLQRDLVERIVPGRDRRDDADRLAHDERIAHLLLEREGLGEFRIRAPVVDRPADLDRTRQLDRHADFARDRLRELLAARLQVLGDLVQIAGALGGRRRGPAVERRARGRDGRFRVFGGAFGDAADHGLGAGVDHVDHALARARAPCTADVELFAGFHRSPLDPGGNTVILPSRADRPASRAMPGRARTLSPCVSEKRQTRRAGYTRKIAFRQEAVRSDTFHTPQRSESSFHPAEVAGGSRRRAPARLTDRSAHRLSSKGCTTMPNSLEAQIRQAMKTGSTLTIEFDQALNQKSPGTLNVFLHPANGGVRIDLDSGNQGEPAKILWLPWKQGELQTLQPGSISTVDMLFFTYYLSGCKVFAGDGGPIWHIDAPVEANQFWRRMSSDEWMEDWEVGTDRQVAYLHRAGQSDSLWNLSAYLEGAAPSTYGRDNLGQAVVGGIVTGRQQMSLYQYATTSSGSSAWSPLTYTLQQRKQ
ncbi:hypothetical protein BURPS1710b_2316 [Burkholderia pseudomallei 1710b]|uniref:Uncharacterized protein n=2 Tax=Burkholderia pseudomallei TaxID=28450 RepID=Q3JRU4_BURP1|nr:hypothetical protein BURPS1710b_2316 [Burkholderia pseudomallei 1710b]